MSEEDRRAPEPELDEAAEEVESPALTALLQRSLVLEETRAPEAAAQDDAKLLASVQKKLRQRSKGKFYSDGWSTTQSRVNYALVATIMLLTIVVVYVMLGPTAISR